MEFLRDFKKINKNDINIAGGKGASLGEMTKIGIPVPAGFVVLSFAFERFLEETDLNTEIDSILHSVNHKKIHTIENASEKITALILKAKIPQDISKEIKKYFKKLNSKYVAVRSSATSEDALDAAWAGQLESYLNTTEKNLLENIKKCWASLFTPRAIFYRFEKGLHNKKISVAVVVQKMIQSEKSGIAFSVHPVTQDKNQLIIEAGFGLGEAIVAGEITPDSYVVEKQPRRIIDRNIQIQTKGLYKAKNGGNEWKGIPESIGSKQVLSDKEILKLSEIILKIENHYGFPCDIEWAFEKNKFYIIQSRPITTLIRKEMSEAEDPLFVGGTKWFLTVTRNMSFWHQYLSNLGHYYNMKDFAIDAILELMTLTVNGTETSAFVHQPNAEDVNKKIIKLITSKNGINNIKSKYETHAKALLESSKKCISNLTLENWNKFQEDYQKFAAGLYITVVIGREGGKLLFSKLKDVGFREFQIPEIIASITYPTEHTPLFQSQTDLLSVGRKIQQEKLSDKEIKKEIYKWLEKHQHIPVNFCEDPWSIKHAEQQLIELMKKDCDKELKALEKSHADRLKKKRAILKKINKEDISILANAIAEGTYLNEFRKNIFSRVSLEYRNAFKMIAERGGSDNWRDVYYLKPEETVALLKGTKLLIPNIMQERKFIAMYVNPEGEIVIVDKAKTKSLVDYVHLTYGKTANNKVNEKEVIKGSIANNGNVRGIVKIILSPKDFDKMEAGNILVTTMTSVDFVPIMGMAAAFVTNEGGITSHASIIAREMNKPCIIGTQIATQILKDGDLVEVDANQGIVKILKRNKK
jgi:phosphohistidine swiveling domain-containing protein